MTTDEHQAIHQRLDRHGEKLEQIIEALAAHTAVCEPMQSRLDALGESLYGNGHAGLITRVDRLENGRRLAGQVAAAAVGLLTGAAGTALAWLLDR